MHTAPAPLHACPLCAGNRIAPYVVVKRVCIPQPDAIADGAE
jgi:hypothetical protein